LVNQKFSQEWLWRYIVCVIADHSRITYANRSIIVAEKSSLAHAARLCTEQINWSTTPPPFSPTAITRIYISARARVRARVSCVNFVITWVPSTVRPTPAISHQPSSRAALSKRPNRFRRGVSNVCERDEMQTGAILFIVRRLYTYRALLVLGRLGMTPGTDSICFTTEKRPRRN